MEKVNSFELIEKVAEFCKNNDNVGYTEFYYENDNSYENLHITIDLIDCINISITNGLMEYNSIDSDTFKSFEYNSIEKLISKIKEIIKNGGKV